MRAMTKAKLSFHWLDFLVQNTIKHAEYMNYKF